ncbi:MAG TPA: class I SAM-dependent methyltransferase [Candidatus Binataceae bacterium]|nr:class I SAM-dependent methyltransferase [Candidatus Binataceae bacterium]
MAPNDKFITLDSRLHDYMTAHGHNSDPILKELADETAALGRIAMMQIAPEQGTFMTILARAIGARRAVEVGTFTGYSSICVARALPDDGHLLCCDVSDEWTKIARRYWERAGVARKITLRIAPALETLRALPADHSFDFAFIDADKTSYLGYYEEILKRMRPGGLILFDNVLWMGAIVNEKDQSADTRALRELNDFIARDTRVDAVMLPIADGLTIARKK